MSDPSTTPAPAEAAEEYGFDPESDPVGEQDSPQAKASSYGMYGHAGQAGAEVGNENPTSVPPTQPVPAPDGVGKNPGSQEDDRGTTYGTGGTALNLNSSAGSLPHPE